MNRRKFLEILGLGGAAIAAAEVIPFNRVWSFPSKIEPVLLPAGGVVRFIRAWDIRHDGFAFRLDVADGSVFPLQLPDGIEYGHRIDSPRSIRTLVGLPLPEVPADLVQALEADLRLRPLRDAEVRWVSRFVPTSDLYASHSKLMSSNRRGE
jgi:hypothetical protein